MFEIGTEYSKKSFDSICELLNNSNSQRNKLEGQLKDISDPKDNPSIGSTPQIICEVFPNDVTDYYGIHITQRNFDDSLINLRIVLQNNGYNTQIFQGDDKTFHLIIYGYGSGGDALTSRINLLYKKIKQIRKYKLESVYMLNIAATGFIEFKKDGIFKYYIPKPVIHLKK